MRKTMLPVYPPGAYKSADIRIKHDFVSCPHIIPALFKLKQLRNRHPFRHIVWAFDALAPSNDDLTLARTFLALGARTQACALNDTRYIDFIL